MGNIGFNFATFTTIQEIQMQIGADAIGGKTNIYPYGAKTRTLTVNDIKIFEK